MDNTGCNFLNNSWVVFGRIHCRLFQEEMLDIRIKNTLSILKEIVGYSRQHAGWCMCSNKGKGYLNHMNCSGRIYKREVITNFSGCTTVVDVHDSWIQIALIYLLGAALQFILCLEDATLICCPSQMLEYQGFRVSREV